MIFEENKLAFLVVYVLAGKKCQIVGGYFVTENLRNSGGKRIVNLFCKMFLVGIEPTWG